MLQRLTSGHVVWAVDGDACGSLSPQVIKKLFSWSQRRFYSKEAGGLLLGYIDSDTDGLLVADITVPGRGDRRSRMSFYRSARHQKEAEIWNTNTDGKGTQLGLWHTHPEPNPSPSHTDLQDCEQVLKDGAFECTGILYLIVGTETIGYWHAKPGYPLTLLGYLAP